jgi:WD40 repeat protein
LKKIDSYGKYKIPQESQVIDFVVCNKRVIAICSDKSIKVWDVDTFNFLKGTSFLEYGNFVSMALSKNDEFLLIGTTEGYVLGYDARKIG